MEATKRRHGLANATEGIVFPKRKSMPCRLGHEVLAKRQKEQRKQGQSHGDVSLRQGEQLSNGYFKSCQWAQGMRLSQLSGKKGKC